VFHAAEIGGYVNCMWLRAEQESQGPGSAASGALLEAENRELKRKLKVAAQEAEIIRRAVAYLIRAVNPK